MITWETKHGLHYYDKWVFWCIASLSFSPSQLTYPASCCCFGSLKLEPCDIEKNLLWTGTVLMEKGLLPTLGFDGRAIGAMRGIKDEADQIETIGMTVLTFRNEKSYFFK